MVAAEAASVLGAHTAPRLPGAGTGVISAAELSGWRLRVYSLACAVVTVGGGLGLAWLVRGEVSVRCAVYCAVLVVGAQWFAMATALARPVWELWCRLGKGRP